MSQDPIVELQDAHALATGYSKNIRRLEVGSIGVYFALMATLGIKLWPFLWKSPWLMLAAAMTGYLGADFISGFVHWLADTWGSTEMPVIGKALIRPFREHHVDQEAITRHDFVETNGNNCLISIVPLLIAVWMPVRDGRPLALFVSTFIGSLVLWVLGTNQFHKWSHLRNPPLAIDVLQRLHLILPPEHHAIHHTAPFNKYYCITTGWMNAPLYWIRFFQTLERLVTLTTGMIPRRDDIGERAAIAVSGVEPVTRINETATTASKL